MSAINTRAKTLLPVTFLLLMAQALPAIPAADTEPHWVASWAASEQLVEPNNALSADDLRNVTLRQIVHLSLAGTRLRLHLSNRYGNASLHLTTAHIAKAVSSASAKIVSESDTPLTFSGSTEITIPAHADYFSDPLTFPLQAFEDLAISLYIDGAPPEQTGHPGSRTTSYLTPGDAVSAPDLADAKTVDHWYFIAGIDVDALPRAFAVAVLGDSITDGHGATTNGNDRWPDILAQRLQASPTTRRIAVLNAGIGGNRLLLDGLGTSALARFDEDVLAPPGVRYLIILEGINDLGMLTHDGDLPASAHDALVRNITAAYQQMIGRAHAHGIAVIGATIMPFIGFGFYHPGPASEADRQAVNAWIRTPGHFDAVLDFDKITRDPEHPDRLNPAFDSGDHLHPSPAGFAAMAKAVPLALFMGPQKTKKL